MENKNDLSIDVIDLIQNWKKFKIIEDQAKTSRLHTETKILENTTIKPKGTTTLSDIKIATRDEMKVDVEIATCLQIPSNLNPFKIKSMSVSMEKLEALKEAYPGIYSQALTAITTTPCKPAFSISRNISTGE